MVGQLIVSMLIPGFGLLYATGGQPADEKSGVRSGDDSIVVLSEEWRDEKRRRDVPVRIYAPRAGDKLPIIVFSHGLGGSRDGYSYLGRHWAKNGFVVIHPEHEGSDRDLLERGAGAGNLKKLEQAAADPRNAINRAQDIRFVITQMIEKVQPGATDSTSVLKGRLNTSKIGMAGHSFGANTTMLVSGLQSGLRIQLAESQKDARIVAAVAMSIPVNRVDPESLDRMYEDVRIPVLHMTGTNDSSPIDLHGPETRRLPFDHSYNSDRTLILFTDGDHGVFAASPEEDSPRRRIMERLRPAANYAPMQEIILESSTHFWKSWLKDDKDSAAWLHEKLKERVGRLGTVEHHAPGEK
ncbi:MAG: hypothetical protein U0996_12670 [Planctomycetaceae bacterium]